MYTTYDRILAEMKGTLAYSGAPTQQQLMQYARTVTNRIKAYGFQFEPQYIVKKITPSRMNVNSWIGALTLSDYLLEVKSLTIGTATLTFGTDVVSEPDNGQYPIQALRFADPAIGPVHSWYPCCGSLAGTVVISGFWGMRTNYASEGFFDSGVVTPILTATQKTMVVTDVAGPDVYYRTPLFSAGNLLLIEAEMIEIVNVDTVTKTLIVRRGMNGTAAVAHAAAQAIYVFEPEEDIVNCATRQAALLYARRGSYQQMTTFPDGVSVNYPSDLLAEVRATVQRFNWIVG